MRSLVDVNIAIVSWNTRDDLARCLTSLRGPAEHLALRVVVVDNGSTDGSRAMVAARFPEVELLAQRRNLGFAAGTNVALRRDDARYHMLLNPDCIVHQGAIEQLVAYADANPSAGLLGPRLVYGDGDLQASCRRFPTPMALLFRNTPLDWLWPSNPWSRGYLMADWEHTQPREVDWLSGACILARSAAVEQIGLLDERFFMYCEDMDWCYRAHRAGWPVVYHPAAVVTHLTGKSSDLRPKAMTREHHRSMVRYVAKHYGQVAALLAWPLIALRQAAVLLPVRRPGGRGRR